MIDLLLPLLRISLLPRVRLSEKKLLLTGNFPLKLRIFQANAQLFCKQNCMTKWIFVRTSTAHVAFRNFIYLPFNRFICRITILL